jgi:hypothetical protein
MPVYPCVLWRRVPGWFVGSGWCAGRMPRRREACSPRVVHRTARAGLRVTRGQRRRLLGLLVSGGDVWACVLELNEWRRARQDRPLASYQQLCQEFARAGPGTFGELDSVGARSVLRRYSDAWFAVAQRRRDGDQRARFPRHVHTPGQAATDPRRPRPPGIVGAAGPESALPARTSPLGHAAVRRRAAMGRCRRRGPSRSLSRWPGAGFGPGGGGGSGHHSPVRGGRAGWPGTAGVGAGDPRRTPDAPGRTQGPPEGGRSPRAQAGAKGVAAVAPLPAPSAAGRGAAPPPGPPGPARSRQDRHRLGRRPPDRHPGRRRPPGRPEAGCGTAAQSAHPRLAQSAI